MRKVFIVALALGSLDPFTQAAFAARNCSIEAGECYAQLKQAGYRLSVVANVCQSRARLCGAENRSAGFNFSGEVGAVNSGGGGTKPGPNTHMVGTATNGMSTTPGAARATTPVAISSTNGGANNSGAMANIGGGGSGGGVVTTNNGVILGRHGGVSGGSGGGPGTAKLKVQ
jgi:hypothetical protein